MPFIRFRTNKFFPLTLSMPLENMLFGGDTLRSRWQRVLNQHAGLSEHWIEPTVLPDTSLIKAIKELQINQVLKQEEIVLAARLDNELNAQFHQNQSITLINDLDYLPYPGPCKVISSLQYMIDHNKEQIIEDWRNGIDNNSLIRHPDHSNTFTAPDIHLSQVYIDDRQGPVVIHKGVTVLAGAKIMGPVVLHPHSFVKMGAELYPGSTIGRHVVVSGEIKNAIIHEFSAKGHAGYLGDSILGRWNNFGAGTITSNVANTFSKARIEDWNTGEIIQLETIKRGLVTGDFVRLGVLSKTYRGTAIGSFSSIATGDAIMGNIRELTWWAGEQQIEYNVDQLRIHCQRQMALRHLTWTDEWENALSRLLAKNIHPKNQNI